MLEAMDITIFKYVSDEQLRLLAELAVDEVELGLEPK